VTTLATVGQRYRLEWTGEPPELLPREYGITMCPKLPMEMRIEERTSQREKSRTLQPQP
jgi:hypothetical protein